jgi:eukaryotic-like serine/threonine-protein kinase
MNRLREVLGDSTENPHFIETIPRRGYRWMLPVEGRLDRSTDAARRYRPTWWFWAAALVAVLGLSGGVLWFVRPASKTTEPRLTISPLTASPGLEGHPSFSPDGNEVAFVQHDRNQSPQIFVKLIGTGGPPLRLTTGSAVNWSPAWSPDGRYIAFLRHLSREKDAVLLIPALGGPERKIAEVFRSYFLVGCSHLSWSPDGNSLVISDQDSPEEPSGLFLLAIITGEKRRLTSPPSQVREDRCPAFSPDGRTLAFSRGMICTCWLFPMGSRR